MKVCLLRLDLSRVFPSRLFDGEAAEGGQDRDAAGDMAVGTLGAFDCEDCL
jgi:hypothetical protein